MKQIRLWLFLLLIFLVPSNLFLKLSIENAYVRGIFVDYLVPKIYLSGIVAVAYCIFYVMQKKEKLRSKSFFLFLCGSLLLLLEQFFLHNVTNSLLHYVQLFSAGALFFCLSHDRALFSTKAVKFSIVLTILFQSLVGIYQFVTGQSLYGYLFLGEPVIKNSLSIVHQQVAGSEHVLPYGTTAHPNILAGVISIYLLIGAYYWLQEKTSTSFYSYLFYAALISGLSCLYFTQSTSAWLALGIGACIIIGQKRTQQFSSKSSQSKKNAVTLRHSLFFTLPSATFLIISMTTLLVTPLLLSKVAALAPKSSSISRRVVLNDAAKKMFIQHPIAGVGLLNFTRQLETIAPSQEVVRFIQPAHNVLLLWIAETGLVGLSTVIFLFILYGRKMQRVPTLWLVLLPLVALDHYVLTIQTGLLLLVVTVSASEWVVKELE